MLAARARKVEAILARFPGPVTLTRSRLKWFAVFAGGLGFVAACIFLLRVRPDDFTAWDVVMAWAGLLFSGAIALVGAAMLLPGAGSLTLAADGFTTCTLFRKSRTPWQQASDFIVEEFDSGEGFLSRNRIVAFNHAAGAGALADFNRSMIARNAALPDTYGLSCDDLAWLMSQWRDRALADARHSPVPRIRSA